MRTTQEVVEDLIMEAPNEAWLLAVVDALDRHLRISPLECVQTLWALSDAESARLFGVSLQAFSRWRQHGIPSIHVPVLANLSTATELLDQYVKRERIPALVRRRSTGLGNRSLYEMACDGHHADALAAVSKMFNLAKVQP